MTALTLSNYLAVLATQAGEKVIAYRRGSVEAIRAYLEAGTLLAEAREACAKRGEWKEVCSVAGVSPAVSRNMRQLAAAGLSPESIHTQGGIQASLDGLRKRTARLAPAHAAPARSHQCGPRASSPNGPPRGRKVHRLRPPGPRPVRRMFGPAAVRSQHRRTLARIGESLVDHLRAASRTRAGIRLTADEVQAILAPAPPAAG